MTDQITAALDAAHIAAQETLGTRHDVFAPVANAVAKAAITAFLKALPDEPSEAETASIGQPNMKNDNAKWWRRWADYNRKRRKHLIAVLEGGE